MKKVLIFNIILLSLLFYSCDYFESDNEENISQLELNLTGLNELPFVLSISDTTKMDTLVYVAWLITDQGIPTKIFRINNNDLQNGNYSSKIDFNMGPIQSAQIFNLTIERLKNDSTPISPSNLLVLSGRFTYSSAKLSITADESDFLNITGTYNLATPTDGNSDTNEKSGLWFIDSLSAVGGPIQGLKLPEIHNGLVYEGWVKINDQFISTGKFTTPIGSDDSSKYSGSSVGFSFPGEDFLQNAPSGLNFPLDLSGSSVYVSIEPNLKINFTRPSKIILESEISNEAQARVSYSMQKINVEIPSGFINAKIDVVK